MNPESAPWTSAFQDYQLLVFLSFTFLIFLFFYFLSDPGVPGVRSMGPDVSNSVQDYVQTLLRQGQLLSTGARVGKLGQVNLARWWGIRDGPSVSPLFGPMLFACLSGSASLGLELAQRLSGGRWLWGWRRGGVRTGKPSILPGRQGGPPGLAEHLSSSLSLVFSCWLFIYLFVYLSIYLFIYLFIYSFFINSCHC